MVTAATVPSSESPSLLPMNEQVAAPLLSSNQMRIPDRA
jgi:hypothetical protein